MIYQEIEVHLNSLDGKMGRAILLGPLRYLGQEKRDHYIFLVNGMLCTGIFNWFACQYYVDDKYGIIDETNENYDTYKQYLEAYET